MKASADDINWCAYASAWEVLLMHGARVEEHLEECMQPCDELGGEA